MENRKPDVNDLMNLIDKARYEQDIDQIKELLPKIEDINQAEGFHRIPLFEAIQFKAIQLESASFELVKLMIEAGADVNVRTSTFGETPLMFAAAMNKPEIVNLLLEKGADAKLQSDTGRTALHCARGLDVMKSLVEKGKAEVNVADKDGDTPLIEIAGLSEKSGDIEDMVQFLIQAGAYEDFSNKEGYSALMKAASVGNAFVVYQLCEARALVDYPKSKKEGYAAPHIAAKNGHANVLNVLLAKEGRFIINLLDKRGNTPLMLAVQNEREDVVRILLDHGANMGVINKDGQDVLMLAKSDDIKDMLLQKKEELKQIARVKAERAAADAPLVNQNKLLKERNRLLSEQNDLLKDQIRQGAKIEEAISRASSKMVDALGSLNINLIHQTSAIKETMTPEQTRFVAYSRRMREGSKAIQDRADKKR